MSYYIFQLQIARFGHLIAMIIMAMLFTWSTVSFITLRIINFRDGKVYDESGTQVRPFPQSECVLKRIYEEPDVKLAVASS